MFKNNFILLPLFYNFVTSYIILPFKGNNLSYIYNNFKKNDFLEDFIMSTFYNQLYTAIGIGIPEQNVLLSIVTKQVDFLFNKMNCLYFYNNNYIDKNNLTPNNRTISINRTHIGYNINLSRSFTKNNITEDLPSYYKNNNYFSGKEKVKIDDYRNILNTNSYYNEIYPYCQDHLVNFSFIYEDKNISKENDNNNEICGSIGLYLYYNKNNYKFIEQLKYSNITSNYYWSFNYTSLDKGIIIFGILPHEYQNDKYNLNDLEEIYTNIDEGDMKWGMNLNEIYFNNKKGKKKEKISVPSIVAEGIFEFTFQLILASYSYQELITKYFFQEFFTKNICKEEEYTLDIKYSIIRCKNGSFKKEVVNFPELIIYNRGLKTNFELTYEDLFITVGDYIYFLVIFRKGRLYQSNQTWKLGIPFLKKHQMIFNSDTKRIGCYVKNKVLSENNKDKNDKNNNNKDKKKKGLFSYISNAISMRTFLEIIIIIIFIIILIYFGKKLYSFKIKQKKPYELQDEDYDYYSNKPAFESNKKKDNCDINNNSNDNNSLSGQIIEMKSH